MIACESKDCTTYSRWYHYFCVGLSEDPENWICDTCRDTASPQVSEDEDGKELFCSCQKTEEESKDFDTRWVGCDGNSCKFEWFHYRCVGMTRKPKNDWFCDECKNQPSTSSRPY